MNPFDKCQTVADEFIAKGEIFSFRELDEELKTRGAASWVSSEQSVVSYLQYYVNRGILCHDKFNNLYGLTKNIETTRQRMREGS